MEPILELMPKISIYISMEDKLVPDNFIIELAGIGIELHPIKKEKMWKLCSQYINENAPISLSIAPTDSDLEKESELAKAHGNELEYPFQKERLFTYRVIAESLLNHDVVLMHAVAVEVDGEAFIFAGPSGAGKSTHAKLWKNHFGDRMKYINDDKPLVKITDDEVRVFGSPWTGKEGLQNNISAPLRAVFFINQSEENRLTHLEKDECWELILNQVYRSKDSLMMKRTLSLMDKLLSHVPVYRLDCNTEPDAVSTAYLAIASS